MKILITGADGQLGRTLQPLFADHRIEAHDRPTLDLEDPVAVARKFADFKPDAVINAAAYTAVDRAETDAARADAINHRATATLATQCAQQGARLFHVSTDFVFDGHRGTPYSTDARCHPLNVYGQTKRDGEKAVLHLLPDTGYVIRTAWLYSAFGNNFVKTMLRLMAERPQLKVVSDQIGTPTCASTLARLLHSMVLNPPAPGIYHCTDAGVASWYDFAVAIQEEALALGLLTRPIDILPIPSAEYPTPAQRPTYSVLDKSRTYQHCNMPLVHWRTPLRETLQQLARTEKSLG